MSYKELKKLADQSYDKKRQQLDDALYEWYENNPSLAVGMTKELLLKTATAIRKEVNVCDEYAIGCFQCQVNRLADDLESLAELMD